MFCLLSVVSEYPNISSFLLLSFSLYFFILLTLFLNISFNFVLLAVVSEILIYLVSFYFPLTLISFFFLVLFLNIPFTCSCFWISICIKISFALFSVVCCALFPDAVYSWSRKCKLFGWMCDHCHQRRLPPLEEMENYCCCFLAWLRLRTCLHHTRKFSIWMSNESSFSKVEWTNREDDSKKNSIISVFRHLVSFVDLSKRHW